MRGDGQQLREGAVAASGNGASGKRAEAAGAGNLTRESIVEAALAQIDEDGLETFSIRTLATRLGVYPTAIYWYVPSRNELLARVATLVLANTLPARRRRSWQHHLRDIFVNFRAAVQAHPKVAPLIGTQLVSNASMSFALVEGLLATLSRAGLTDDRLVAGYNSLVAGLVGFSAQEFAPLPRDDPTAWQLAVQERLLSLDREAYPTLAANLPLLSNRAFILRWQSGAEAPLDDSFTIFVDVMIAGIEAMVSSPNR